LLINQNRIITITSAVNGIDERISIFASDAVYQLTVGPLAVERIQTTNATRQAPGAHEQGHVVFRHRFPALVEQYQQEVAQAQGIQTAPGKNFKMYN